MGQSQNKMGQRQNKIRPKDIEELAAYTNFTEDEVKQWFGTFMETCRQGILSQEEFKNFYNKYFPVGDASHFAQHACSSKSMNLRSLEN